MRVGLALSCSQLLWAAPLLLWQRSGVDGPTFIDMAADNLLFISILAAVAAGFLRTPFLVWPTLIIVLVEFRCCCCGYCSRCSCCCCCYLCYFHIIFISVCVFTVTVRWYLCPHCVGGIVIIVNVDVVLFVVGFKACPIWICIESSREQTI